MEKVLADLSFSGIFVHTFHRFFFVFKQANHKTFTTPHFLCGAVVAHRPNVGLVCFTSLLAFNGILIMNKCLIPSLFFDQENKRETAQLC